MAMTAKCVDWVEKRVTGKCCGKTSCYDRPTGKQLGLKISSK